MRFIALDVHRDFCEVAIRDESGLRFAGKVNTAVGELQLFAQSLAPDDQVALEASEPALWIARILHRHVGRVAIAKTRKPRAIAESEGQGRQARREHAVRAPGSGVPPCGVVAG
jgi:transposase